MWVVPIEEHLVPNWIPDNMSAQRHLRIPEQGTLLSLETSLNGDAIMEYDELDQALAAAKGSAKKQLKLNVAVRFPQGRPLWRRPQLDNWQGYSRVDNAPPAETAFSGPFDPDLLILTKEIGRPLGMESTLQLTGALRDAMLKAAPQGDQPEWFCGHRLDGTPTDQPHLAIFPLPFVDGDHADGHILGLAIAVPSSIAADSARRFLGPLFFSPETGQERTIKLWKSGQWEWHLHRETASNRPMALQAKRWTGPSTEWASVTPVVLHHYPKKSRDGDVERIVREAFASALLPEPVEIETSPVSKHPGAGHVREMPFFDAGGERLCRYQVHVVARFDRLIEGPMLVGRGRFRGYGVFHPLGAKNDRV
jgi:CRISPR-associated protein Csb2